MLIAINKLNPIQAAQMFKIEKLKKQPYLSPIQNLQLDFLKDELTMYSKQAQTAWVDNVNILLIVESAELLLASSNDLVKPFLKDKIITLFKDAKVPIEITAENIIKKIDHDKPSIIKKKVHHEKSISTKPYQPPKLNRIHGAGRTLRQIKDRYKSNTINDGNLGWQSAMQIASKKIEAAKVDTKTDTTTDIGLLN